MWGLLSNVRVVISVVCPILLSGCMGTVAKPLCTSNQSPPPYWVYHNEILKDAYVGIGQAELDDGGIAHQKQLAGKRALADLLEKIQVTVSSSMEITENQKRNANGGSSATKTTRRHLQVASCLTLNEVTAAGSYLDPATCTLWIRYKIRRDLADNLIALKQAGKLYQMTVAEKEAPPAQKIRWITEALARLEDVDFSVLPKNAGNKNNLLARFSRRKAELEKSGSRKAVWVLSAPSPLKARLRPALHALARTYGAAYIDVTCDVAHACLDQAREYAGRKLVWIKANGNVSSGSMGMQKGYLQLELSRFDVGTGACLATHSNDGRAFAFDEEGIAWAKLAKQLLAKEAMAGILK